MKKTLKTIGECAVFGALIFTLTITIYNLYALKTGAPLVW